MYSLYWPSGCYSISESAQISLALLYILQLAEALSAWRMCHLARQLAHIADALHFNFGTLQWHSRASRRVKVIRCSSRSFQVRLPLSKTQSLTHCQPTTIRLVLALLLEPEKAVSFWDLAGMVVLAAEPKKVNHIFVCL